MARGGMRPGDAVQPLRQRISGELTRILRGYVLVLTALLSVSTLLLGYYYKLTQLAHQQDLVSIRLGTELRNFARELRSLSHSTVLATALTDGRGRQGDLASLRSRFSEDGLRALQVLDHRGRLVLVWGAPSIRTLDQLPVVQQVLEGSRQGPSLSPSKEGMPLVVLTYPVFLPERDAPVGFLVGTLDVSALLASMSLGQVQPSVAVGESPFWPTPPAGLMLRHRSEDGVGLDGADIRLKVMLSEPVLSALAPGALVAMVVFLLGRWTLVRVVAWAHRFSAATTSRLDHLLASSHRVLAGQAPLDLPAGPRDEISQAVDTLGAMLRQQKQITDALRTSSLVFATAAEGIVVTDAQAAVTQVNPALLRMTGFGVDGLVGRPVSALYSLADGDAAPARIARALALRGRWSGESALLDRQGRALEVTVSVSQLTDGDGTGLGQVWVFTDVSRLKRAEKQLRDMAYLDGLTRLPNLRVMGERVRQRLAANPAPCVLLFLDLDRLKQVNDDHGHEAGDWMIRGMAEHLRRHLPAAHLLCRRSGDEFIALVERDPDSDAPGWQALLALLSQARVMLPTGPLNVTATIGVARFPRDGLSWTELQVCADLAMRAAKQVRRGSVAWYDAQLGRDLRRRGQVHQRLIRAMEQALIELHYQPVVDLASGRLLGAEALARWSDPQLGEVAPAEFFAAAQEAQLTEALSLQLLHQLLRDMPRIQRHWPGLVLAFNVAPQSLRDPQLLDALTQALARHPQWVGLLEVELTEAAMAGSGDALLAPLQQLGKLGVRLVIDDFGTGHSSLSRLAQFPLSGLKIDASFVAHLDQGRHQRIVALVVNLARVLQLQVVAEGVETQVQRQHLLRLGCARGQGWLYGPAMSLEDLLRPPAQWPQAGPSPRVQV